MSVNPEQVAVDGLRDYLLAHLPARVAVLNAANAAVLKSLVGPFALPSGGTLTLATARDAAGTAVTLPTGAAVTAAAIVSAINGTPVSGLTASADDAGRLVLTRDAAPADGTDSVVAVVDGAINTVFGWDIAGEYIVRSWLTAPDWKHFRDGWPEAPPDGTAKAFYVVIEDRGSKFAGAAPREMNDVVLNAAVLAPLGTSEIRDRRRITLCVSAIREVLSTPAGRGLGNASAGAVQLARVQSSAVAGKSLLFKGTPAFFDVANIVFHVRVFCAPLA